MLQLLDEPAQDTLIKDSVKRVREQLAQIPDGKKAVMVSALEYKFGFVPTWRTGLAYRTPSGWEVHGEAFLSKAEKGARITVVRTW